MSIKQKVGIGIAAFVGLYAVASVIMSLCWFTNLGSYDGPRFGLLVVDVAVAVVEKQEGYTEENGLICGYDKNGYIGYESGKFQLGDKVTTLSIMNPFSRYSDDVILRLDFKHL